MKIEYDDYFIDTNVLVYHSLQESNFYRKSKYMKVYFTK